MQNSEIKTTCSYCGVGCGIIVTNDSKNGVEVRGDESHPVNRGMLCSKGMNLHYVVNDTSDRILFPEMRWSKSHPKERVSWDAALDRAAAVFSSIIKKHGPDSVGFYISGQCLTEEYYLVNKLVKGFLKTNNIDTNSRLCMSSAVAGYKKTFGEDSVPIAYDDIELADTFLITGANGFVGKALCAELLRRGRSVRAAVRSANSTIKDTEVVSVGSIDDETDWTEALRDVDWDGFRPFRYGRSARLLPPNALPSSQRSLRSVLLQVLRVRRAASCKR